MTTAIETNYQADQCVRLIFLQTCFHKCGHVYENTSRNLFYICRKQGMHSTFKTCCIILVWFSTNCPLFCSFICFYSNNAFFVNHVLIFKYPPHYYKAYDRFHSDTRMMEWICGIVGEWHVTSALLMEIVQEPTFQSSSGIPL